MTLRDSLRAIVSGWKIVGFSCLVGLVVAGLLSWPAEADYVSHARLFAAAETDAKDPEELFQRNLIATQRLASYVELVSSDAVAVEVARILGDKTEARSLPSMVSASTPEGTVILDLQVTGPTPEETQRVAEAYAEAVPKVISQVEQVGAEHAAQVSVTMIESPKLGVSTKQSLPVELALGALLGFVIGAGIAIIRTSIQRGSPAGRDRPAGGVRSTSDAG